MELAKKFFFAPFFLLLFALFCYLLNPILGNINIIFSLDLSVFVSMLTLSATILAVSLFFIIFVCLSQNIKIILPVILVAAILPLLIMPAPISFVLAAGSGVSLLIISSLLESHLRSYLTFNPNLLLTPSIKNLSVLILIISAFCFYLTSSKEIKEKGFVLPASLLEIAIKAAMPQTITNFKGVKYLAQTPSLTKEQIELLKQHPELLKQYGVDPAVLNQLPAASPKSKTSTEAALPTSNPLLKTLLKDQIDKMIKPYLNWVPAVLAVIFYFTLSFLTSFLRLLLPPIIWFIFYLLERSGFVHFEKEMREVKKMVV